METTAYIETVKLALYTMDRDTTHRVIRAARMTARISNAGITITIKRALVRVSNVSFVNGRLHDGTGHYERRYIFSGNTYPIRDILKNHGFQYDGAKKYWYMGMAAYRNLNAETISEEICRRLAGK